MKLHTETSGRGPDLFLIHGWGMNAAVWSGLREALQADYRITTVDLPGHGRSTAADPNGADLSGHGIRRQCAPAKPVGAGLPANIRGQARSYSQDLCNDWLTSVPFTAAPFDLASAADALLEVAPAQAIWIGWSLGGMLALQAAKQAPQRIAQLSLITSSPRFVTTADWPHAVDPSVLEQFFTGLQQDYRATLKRFLALQVRGSEAANTTLRDLRQGLFAHGEPDAAALAAGLAILRDADLRPQLGTLTMPVQFIMGERDTLMPAAAAFAARALAPHAAVSIIEGAGHAPFLSHPQAFLDALLPFLQAAAPRNTGARHHGG